MLTPGPQWEFLVQTSADANNNIVGIVRDKAETDKRVATELADRSNITILEADLTDHVSIKVREVATRP